LPEYLDLGKVKIKPILPDNEIRHRMIWPSQAFNAGIEGSVMLRLFIDPRGTIRRIDVINEKPKDWGFGEAARNAFKGITAEPARAENGNSVAVQLLYPIRFEFRN